jgi:transposase-like protein
MPGTASLPARPNQEANCQAQKTRKAIKDWHIRLPNLASWIDNVKLIVQFLDFIEDHRDLTIQQWNFRDIMLLTLQDLLSKQKTY